MKEQSGEMSKTENKKSSDISIIVLLSIAATIIFVLAIIFFFMQSSNKFTYEGLSFEKSLQGSISFYSVKVPAINANQQIVAYNEVDFRNDPRKLKDIPINTFGQIGFITDKTIYISIDKDMPKCDGESIVAIGNLGLFLSNFGLEKKGVVNNPDYQNRTDGALYGNCDVYPENTVIMIFPGNSSEIRQVKNNCYHIIVGNCQSTATIEKFQLQMLQEYYSRLGLI